MRALRTLKQPGVQDVLIAGALTATSLVGLLAHLHVDLPEGGGDEATRPLDALGIILVLLQTVPLVWRRRAPIFVLAVTTAALFLFYDLGYFRSFASVGFLVALYTVAAYRIRRLSIPAGILCAFVVMLIVAIGDEPVEPDTVIAECLMLGAVWFIGDGLRFQRSQVLLLEDRASRLEKEREELAQRAVADERRLIARELHDVVAHSVSVMVAQAGAAQQVAATQPQEALDTLGSIENTGRAALVEMRRLMGLLRTETDRDVARSPQPGLDNLQLLVSQVRGAGLPVTLELQGDPRPVPAGLDLCAFRIVQEALTNVLKHAGPAQAHVVVRHERSRLTLSITDDGWGRDGRRSIVHRARYGHLGMRERVALFHGDLDVGRSVGGGYHVIASLPLDGEPA